MAEHWLSGSSEPALAAGAGADATGVTPFGIALGSNLGDRAANLRRAIAMLLARVPDARLAAAASFYETEPVDCAPGTQPFLNTVIEVAAGLTPDEMHAHLIAVEQALGRPAQRERNAPRSLDIDLLYAGNFVSDAPALTVPHPRLHLRRFVLQPLFEIRPNLVLPGQTKSIAELLGELTDDPKSVRKVE